MCDLCKEYIRLIQAQADVIAVLREELETTDRLLSEHNRVLEAIPPCPAHGNQCVPHALEWIEEHDSKHD